MDKLVEALAAIIMLRANSEPVRYDISKDLSRSSTSRDRKNANDIFYQMIERRASNVDLSLCST